MKKILIFFTGGIVFFICVYILARLMAWGTSLPTFSILKFMAFYVPLLLFLCFLMTRSDQLGSLLLISIALIPVLGFKVPPARIGITGLDVVTLTVTLLIIYRRYLKQELIDLFPSTLLILPICMIIPSVIFSIEPITSFLCFIRIIAFYFLLVALLHYFQDKSWRNRFFEALVFSLFLTSASVILERLTGINLSLGYHPGKITESGMIIIRRYSGFFQDPQKAAQFMACTAAYVVVLVCRGIIHERKQILFSWITLTISVIAILITATRASILAGLPLIIGTAVFFNRFRPIYKLIFTCVVVATMIALICFISPRRTIDYLLPQSARARLEHRRQAFLGRLQIWQKTWHIFKEKPITGIGLGNYQEYLMRENPTLRSLHRLGGYVPNMPESGYLKILYEGGILGALGCLFLIGGIVYSGFKIVTTKSTQRGRVLVWSTLFGLAVFMATFLTVFTISDPRNAILPLLLFLPILHLSKNRLEKEVAKKEV